MVTVDGRRVRRLGNECSVSVGVPSKTAFKQLSKFTRDSFARFEHRGGGGEVIVTSTPLPKVANSVSAKQMTWPSCLLSTLLLFTS